MLINKSIGSAAARSSRDPNLLVNHDSSGRVRFVIFVTLRDFVVGLCYGRAEARRAWRLPALNRQIVAATTSCTNCYDYGGTPGRWPRVYFLGQLKWSAQAREAMQTALPKP
jgi:hypothetical protein